MEDPQGYEVRINAVPVLVRAAERLCLLPGEGMQLTSTIYVRREPDGHYAFWANPVREAVEER